MEINEIEEVERINERTRQCMARHAQWERKHKVRPVRVNGNTVLLLPPHKCNESYIAAWRERTQKFNEKW